MLKTLEWFYDIQGGDAEMANYGVGIIPYVYEEARDYYLKTYTAQQLNFGKNFNDYKPKEIVIETTIPERKKEIGERWKEYLAEAQYEIDELQKVYDLAKR